MKLPKFITETEEERIARQTKEIAELAAWQNKDEQRKLHKLDGDKIMIQHMNSSTTDEKGRHYVNRIWKLVELHKAAPSTT